MPRFISVFSVLICAVLIALLCAFFSIAFIQKSGVATSEQVNKLQTGNFAQKCEAIEELEKLGQTDVSAVEGLLSVVGDPTVAPLVARALGKIGPKAKRAVPALLKAARGDSPELRSEIIIALAQINPESNEVIKFFAESLSDKDELVRINSSAALAKNGVAAASAIAQLTKAIEDSSPSVRRNVAAALGSCGKNTKETAASLLKLLNDSDKNVRANAIISLGKLGAAANAAVPELKLLLEKDPDSAQQIRDAIKKIEDSSSNK